MHDITMRLFFCINLASHAFITHNWTIFLLSAKLLQTFWSACTQVVFCFCLLWKELRVCHVISCLYCYGSNRRQHNDYSPQVAKYPRLETYSRQYSPYPAIRNTLPPPPPPPPPPLHPPPPSHRRTHPPSPHSPYAIHASAGPSRSDFSHFISTSQPIPRPRVPALPTAKSHNSLQAFASDEVAFTSFSPAACGRSLMTVFVAFSWAVRWWSCLKLASSGLPTWSGRRGSERSCSKKSNASMQVSGNDSETPPPLFFFVLILCFLQWHGCTWPDLLWMV